MSNHQSPARVRKAASPATQTARLLRQHAGQAFQLKPLPGTEKIAPFTFTLDSVPTARHTYAVYYKGRPHCLVSAHTSGQLHFSTHLVGQPLDRFVKPTDLVFFTSREGGAR